MQPSPRAETSRLLFPSLRFFIASPSMCHPRRFSLIATSLTIDRRRFGYLPVSMKFLPDSPEQASQSIIGSRASMRTRRSTIHKPEIHTNFALAPVQIFAANERMNQLVIEDLDPAAWRPKYAVKPLGNLRTIAAIFTHM